MHRPCVGVALGGREAERPRDHGFELGVDAGPHRRDGRRGPARPAGRPRGALEGPPRERLPEHDAHRVDVGAPVGRRARGALGRHVRRRAPGGRGRRPPHRLDHAEVEHFHPAFVGDEQALRVDVAVHEGERRAVVVAQLVRVVQAGQALGRHARRPRRRHLGPRAPRPPQHLVEGLALEVLGHDEGRPAPLADLEGVHDVRVLQPRREPRRLQERRARRRRRLAQQGAQRLDHDQPIEARGAERGRQRHLGRARAAKRGQKLVSARRARFGRDDPFTLGERPVFGRFRHATLIDAKRIRAVRSSLAPPRSTEKFRPAPALTEVFGRGPRPH